MWVSSEQQEGSKTGFGGSLQLRCHPRAPFVPLAHRACSPKDRGCNFTPFSYHLSALPFQGVGPCSPRARWALHCLPRADLTFLVGRSSQMGEAPGCPVGGSGWLSPRRRGAGLGSWHCKSLGRVSAAIHKTIPCP